MAGLDDILSQQNHRISKLKERLAGQGIATALTPRQINGTSNLIPNRSTSGAAVIDGRGAIHSQISTNMPVNDSTAHPPFGSIHIEMS